jgi:hypothetical protein
MEKMNPVDFVPVLDRFEERLDRVFPEGGVPPNFTPEELVEVLDGMTDEQFAKFAAISSLIVLKIDGEL